MNAIVYKNTKSPSFLVEDFHLSEARGLAYEQDGYFIHIYGKDNIWWDICPGMMVIQGVDGTLDDWVQNTFGAENIETLNLPVGEVLIDVWRPG